MQFVRGRKLSINNHERPIKISGAVDLQLVGEGIPREPVSVALKEQNVEADLVSIRCVLLLFVRLFDSNFFPKNTEQGLFISCYIGAENGFPEVGLGLEDVLEARVLLLVGGVIL